MQCFILLLWFIRIMLFFPFRISFAIIKICIFPPMITPRNSIYLLFLTILLFNLSENTNIKEISNAQIDHFYANLFGLSSDENFKKSNEKVGNLSLPEIEPAIFYNDINEMFKLAKQTKNLNKNQKDLLNKKLIEFEKIIIDSQHSTPIVKSCEIWKFWHEIYNVFAEHKILEAKMNVVFVQKHSKSINYETINCTKMEESLKSGKPINKSANYIEEFLKNQKWLHYSVIRFLIGNSTEPNKQILLGNNSANAKQNWKLFEYFGHTKLNDESEFAYKMRTLRTKDVIKNTIKSKIEKIIGESLLEELEYQQPLLMSFDIIDEEKLAKNYVQMLSADQTLSKSAELKLLIRMLFGRILDLFTNVYAIKTKNKQKREFFAEFEEYWSKKFMKILQQFSVDSIFNVYSFWHSLVKLNNKNKILKRSFGSIATVPLTAKPLDAIRYELLEQHTINLIRLNQSKNAFSEFLKNSLTEEKGALHKLNTFYIDQNEHMALKCFEKYPDIQRMCRAELSFDQITLLEIKNYIRYFDYKTDELMWLKAELLLSMLAYYKLFLNHSKRLPIDIQATTEFMATTEDTMDSVVDHNNVEGMRLLFEKEIFVLHMAKNKLSHEEIIVYEESKEPIKRFLLETHNQVVNVLLENDAFVAKLKDIYIDRERLSNIFPQNSKTFKLLIAGSLHDVPTESITDLQTIEAFNLTKIYEDIMIGKKSELVKDHLTIEASYFYYKILLKDLLSMLTPLKSMKKPKFMRMVIEVEVENAKLEDFLSKLNKNDGKAIKICYLKSFTSSIIENRAMILENATWKDLLIERNYLNNKEIMRDSPNSHIKWVKPECENQQITAQIVDHLSISPNYERIHSFILSDLIQKFPEFLHFVNANAFKFPGLQKLATFDDKKGILLYKKIITETNIAAKSIFYENILAVKLLIQTIKYREQILANDALINSQSCAKAKAETFAILRIISIYKIGEESEVWRYVCPLEGYLNYLTERTFYMKTKWRLNCQCFDQKNIHETLRDRRNNFYQKHLELIENHLLDEKVGEKDVLVNVLREQRGTIAKLKSLLYLNGMIKLWENPQIQPKLLNKAFFHNKKWLLSHYIGTLTATSKVVKQNERIAADLFVFAMHFYDEKLDNMNKIMHELMNKLWLYVRISYDMCYMEREKANNFSLKIRNFIPKMNQLILMDKNGVSKLKIILNKIKKMALADEEKQEIETNESVAAHKTIQKMHSQMLEKITASEKDDEQLITPFNQLVEELNGDIEKRSNFLQFLDLEDLKKFFQTAGISYNSLEFSTKLLDESFDQISQEIDQNEDTNQMEIDDKSTNSLDFEETESASIDSPLRNDRQSEDGNLAESEEKDETNDEPETPILSNEKITSTNKNVVIKKGNKKITNFPYFLTKANANLNFKKIYDSIIPLKAFGDDNALYERYKTIAQTKPSKEKQIILSIGTLVNEIENLSKMVQHLLNFNFLQYFNDRKRVENLVQLWTIIKQVSFTLKIENFENLQAFVNKLFHFLYDILSHLDGYNYLGQMSDLEIFETEKYHLLEQIHVRKFAFSLINDAKCMPHDDIKKKLFKILGTKFSPIHFEQLKTDWNKMGEQIEIDAELYRKHFMFDISPNSSCYIMMPTFPIISQQQITDSYKRNEMSLTRELKNYMFIEIYEKSSLNSKEEFDHRIQLALIKIYSMVKDWSKERARLLVAGSFLLGANAFDSDIDLICVVPDKTIQKSEFFGNNETFCQQNKCSVQEKAVSFYCQLCENENVTNLVKITYGTVMIIKFKFDQIDIDMPFVKIPNRKSLPRKINDENLQNFVKKSDILNIEHKKMLKALSGYRSILYIKNLLDMQNNGDWEDKNKQNQKISQPKKKADNFRLVLLALKLWAKNNYIYSNKFGYLNGIILTIMVTKIVLLYPNSTVPFLMEKFFLFYATRPFQVPIQLNKNSVEPMANDPFFVQNPTEQQMPVITPAFPLQNASKMVTHSTAKIIRRELIEGLNRIRAMKMENNFDWAKLLNHSVPFVDKYDQFIVINCMAESSVGGDNFCQFVDGRIRLQIVDSIDVENEENIVVETQLFPDVYRHDCLLSKQFVKTSFRTNACKMWIVGIKFGQNIVKINGLLDRFDQTIKKHYLKYNPIDVKNLDIKNYFKKLDECDIATEIGKLKVELKSILVTRHELIARGAKRF